MLGMLADYSLLNWHKYRKDLISRRSGRGAPVTPATPDFSSPLLLHEWGRKARG
jgi:hypothetical protein